MHRLKAFFKNIFVRNLIIIVGLFFIILWVVNIYLKQSTCLGCQISVPDFKGLTEGDVKELCEAKKLDYVIRDTAYEKDLPKMAIVDQMPRALSMVKEGRTIYLTINSPTIPMVKLKNVEDMPARQATKFLENDGFVIDPDWEYQPDIMLDWVLKAKHKGEEVEWGTKLPKGAQLTFVVGNGQKTDLKGPQLEGYEFEFALEYLKFRGLIIGDIDSSRLDEPSAGALVYRVIPDSTQAMKPSDPIDIILMDSFALRQLHPDLFRMTKDRR